MQSDFADTVSLISVGAMEAERGYATLQSEEIIPSGRYILHSTTVTTLHIYYILGSNYRN